MAMKLKMIVLGCILIIMAAEVQAGLLGDFFKGLGSAPGKSPDVQTTASGLKEALSVGTGTAVGMLSKQNGYFQNQMVKILMPKQIQKMAVSTV